MNNGKLVQIVLFARKQTAETWPQLFLEKDASFCIVPCGSKWIFSGVYITCFWIIRSKMFWSRFSKSLQCQKKFRKSMSRKKKEKTNVSKQYSFDIAPASI